ncbi:ATP-binding cassette domain-containing protein, partial [Candidatus Bipolaricaulota bacterium]|nr:ATP-binding cassette domain-containing protein [Candidatus Bipolaricaulota bacterium]
CGKSTLLFSIAGLLTPCAGSISIDGQAAAKPRRDVALILQNAGLLPWKTVWQNANLSLRLGREPRERTAADVLRELGLYDVRDRFPSELSEGMKRRVGIARALSTSPSVMLMDEPLASLDTLTRERIQDLFLRLWHRHGFSLLIVTHDIEEAAFLGQRIIVLSDRPARVNAVVDNPNMGDLEFRRSDAFYATMAALREALEQ